MRRSYKEVRFPEENYSNTQPNLSHSIGQIVNRLQAGQSVPQTEMPIYLGDDLQQLIGFENLTKLEQIDLAREWREQAQKQYDTTEKEAREKNAEINAQIRAEAILQEQKQQAEQAL